MGLTRINNQALTDVTSDGLPSGTVLQVKRSSDRNLANISTTSTTFTGSGLTVSITPKKSNSLILIDYIGSMGDKSTANYIQTKIYMKVGTGSFAEMSDSGVYSVGYQDANNRYAPMVCSTQYTATSTDTLTFEVYYKSGSGDSTKIAHVSSSYSFTATEIAV